MNGLMAYVSWRETLNTTAEIAKAATAILAAVTASWALIGKKALLTLERRRVAEISAVVTQLLLPIRREQQAHVEEHRALTESLNKVAADLDAHRSATEATEAQQRKDNAARAASRRRQGPRKS